MDLVGSGVYKATWCVPDWESVCIGSKLRQFRTFSEHRRNFKKTRNSLQACFNTLFIIVSERWRGCFFFFMNKKIGSWTWLAVDFTTQHHVSWLWECLHWLKVQSISEHFSECHGNWSKSRNGLAGPPLQHVHYCHRNRFQSVCPDFLIGLKFWALSAVDLQGNMVRPDSEREREWERAQTFRKLQNASDHSSNACHCSHSS